MWLQWFQSEYKYGYLKPIGLYSENQFGVTFKFINLAFIQIQNKDYYNII